MDKHELERRTKAFALRVIRFVSDMPRSRAADVIGYQRIKAATSVGGNYREANRAESFDDFIHKIGIVEKETSECCYWLELCEGADLGDRGECAWLLKEANELLAIFTSSGRTARANRAQRRSHRSRQPGTQTNAPECCTE